MPNDFIWNILLDVEQPFAPYTLVVIWEIGWFPRTVGYTRVVYLLYCDLPLARIFRSQSFVQIQMIIKNIILAILRCVGIECDFFFKWAPLPLRISSS